MLFDDHLSPKLVGIARLAASSELLEAKKLKNLPKTTEKLELWGPDAFYVRGAPITEAGLRHLIDCKLRIFTSPDAGKVLPAPHSFLYNPRPLPT